MKFPDLNKPIFKMFPDKAERVKQGLCTDSTCDSKIESARDFRDGISYDEYGISGLCQECQDSIFGVRGASENNL